MAEENKSVNGKTFPKRYCSFAKIVYAVKHKPQKATVYLCKGFYEIKLDT